MTMKSLNSLIETVVIIIQYELGYYWCDKEGIHFNDNSINNTLSHLIFGC